MSKWATRSYAIGALGLARRSPFAPEALFER